MLLEWIIALLVVAAGIHTYLKFRKKIINTGEYLLWTALWAGILLVSFFPGSVRGLSSFLGIGRAVDFVLYASVYLIFFLIFKLYVRVEMQEREITRLTREIAIKRARKK